MSEQYLQFDCVDLSDSSHRTFFVEVTELAVDGNTVRLKYSRPGGAEAKPLLGSEQLAPLPKFEGQLVLPAAGKSVALDLAEMLLPTVRSKLGSGYSVNLPKSLRR